MVILVSPKCSFLNKNEATSRAGHGDSKGRKRSEILRCLGRPKVDLRELRKLCLTEGGLLSADLRERAWHKLLGIDFDFDFRKSDHDENSENMKTCRSEGKGACAKEIEDIIDIDVNRAVYFRYKQILEEGEEEEECSMNVRDGARAKLCQIIKTTLNRIGSGLNYYQGFHDIASVVYVNIPNEALATAILHRIAESYLQDAMQENFAPITSLLEESFYPLLGKLDRELHDFLQAHQLQPTAFLTWIITLFSHDVHNHEIASRLFDSILASHSLFPLYLSMAILTHERNRRELFDIECEDPAMLQVIATRLIFNLTHCNEGEEGAFTVQAMVDNAVSYMQTVPPESLLDMIGRRRGFQNDENIRFMDRIDSKVDSVFSDWMQRKMRSPDQPSSMNLRAGIFESDDHIFFFNPFDMNSNHEKCEIFSSPSLIVSETSSEEGDYF